MFLAIAAGMKVQIVCGGKVIEHYEHCPPVN